MNKLEEEGYKLYEDFLKKIFGEKRKDMTVVNPRTKSAKLFARLNKYDVMQCVGAMCRELASNTDEDYFVDDNDHLCISYTASERCDDNEA